MIMKEKTGAEEEFWSDTDQKNKRLAELFTLEQESRITESVKRFMRTSVREKPL